MMRRIKFRGRRPEGGYIYGGINDLGTAIIVNGLPWYVEPGSIAQYVGTDSQGEELYEGDVVSVDYEGLHKEYKVHYQGFATAEDGCYLAEIQLKKAKLKK